MKKYLAIILATVAFTGALTACSGKIKDTANIVAGDKEVVAVTDKDGVISRDESGNALVVVTDEDGKAKKGEDGKVETSAVEVSHAVVMGDRIETATFSVIVPDGWAAGNSYDTVNINSTDKNQTQKIVINIDETKENATPSKQIVDLVVGAKEVTVNKETNDTVKIAGLDANRTRYDITSETIETRVLSYYSFEGPSATYGVICYSKDAKTADKAFEEVLNTMVLY